MKELITKDLLGHSNMDVKVSIASCLSEITRIITPNASYDDDIFRLIIGAFKNLDKMSSRSFLKRVSILETVVKWLFIIIALHCVISQLIYNPGQENWHKLHLGLMMDTKINETFVWLSSRIFSSVATFHLSYSSSTIGTSIRSGSSQKLSQTCQGIGKEQNISHKPPSKRAQKWTEKETLKLPERR
ncbi:hypothetical protein MA16_Dca017956 [Dendrobium catenatum]|uniref:Uncharacterized protein n=1 Tax=Dendrobium catenatum TaxID=906689 RepID=A0A2I0X9H2_9ASPA|nr:hypothetical protein MA16_Dca017956 [Dendrobium catenatum]